MLSLCQCWEKMNKCVYQLRNLMSGLWDHSVILETFITSMHDLTIVVNIVITMFFAGSSILRLLYQGMLLSIVNHSLLDRQTAS